jgi:hypothetical protein
MRELKGINSLIAFWSALPIADAQGRYIHRRDETIITPWTAEVPARAAVAQVEEDLAVRNGALHLTLSPVPYVGNLRSADVFLAMINPTVGWQDYVDHAQPAFHELLKANLHQDLDHCFALDPAVAVSWSSYYRRMFNQFVRDYARTSDRFTILRDRRCNTLSDLEQKVWAELQRRMAILELIPYYSQTADKLLESNLHLQLASALAARRALQDVAKESPEDAFIICKWKLGPDRWGIPRTRCSVAGSRMGLDMKTKMKLRRFLDRNPRLSA